MRIVFMGTPQFAVESLTELIKANYNVIGVVTQPDRPKGRGKKLTPSPVKEKALELGLPVYQPVKVKDEGFLEELERLNPDVIIVVAYGQILPRRILELPKYGCINVHASLLPKYRGAAPIHWAIINGEEETGITTMLMDEGLDTGDILLQAKISIDIDTNAGELHDKLAILGGQVLIETLKKLEKGQLKPESQKDEFATYAPLLTKEHEKILWNKNKFVIHNLVRGLNPWPGAYTLFKGNRIKIIKTIFNEITSLSEGKAGQIVGIDNKGLWVQTNDMPILVSKLQPAGKKVMSAKDFINGYSVKAGDFLGDLNE